MHETHNKIIHLLLVEFDEALDVLRQEGYWSRLKDIGWTFRHVEELVNDIEPKPFWVDELSTLNKNYF